MSNIYESALDTIAALATAPGHAGIGIIRISGQESLNIAKQILHIEPAPRYAHYGTFYDHDGKGLDSGIILYFPGPYSFTGEDVVEFQAHGGPVILDLILKRVIELGARHAHPGEFTQQAFLNNKIDLTQAEAVADLIGSCSEQAARYALKSLQGAFSQRINKIIESLVQLRTKVEGAIDFPEEENNYFTGGGVTNDVQTLLTNINRVIDQATQGAILREGITVVIAGHPNAGKSSLMNILTGKEVAIVTDIVGTTRDLLREHINIDGIPLHIIDTAGLRATKDQVEGIGITKAFHAIEEADRVLLMVDGSTTAAIQPKEIFPEFATELHDTKKITVIRNKIDLIGEQEGLSYEQDVPVIRMSVKNNSGIELLQNHIKTCAGFRESPEDGFSARRRHLDALQLAKNCLDSALSQLTQMCEIEILAEDLRQAQNFLGEITGRITSDELLGEIFSSFCIGK